MKKRTILPLLLSLGLAAMPLNAFAEEPSTEYSYDTLLEMYETLESEHETALARISELEAQIAETEAEPETEALPEYDIAGTIQTVGEDRFSILTEKGNTYTFGLEDFEIETGAKVAFHYKGNLSADTSIPNGTITGFIVTQEAPPGAEYETGITYDNLARDPDTYKYQKVKFKGKVIQLIEDTNEDEIQIRLAVDSNYDTVLFGAYDKSIVSSRVLEDDIITIYGSSLGLLSYQSTMGGQITIPAVLIEEIVQ